MTRSTPPRGRPLASFPVELGYALAGMLALKPITALVPGSVISGKYRVERPLGAGGMGVVVAARHVDLQQSVAIKVLLPTASNNDEMVARFLREGRSAAQLTSPHVAKVQDTGRLPSGEPYLVMELLHGRDLRAHLASVGRVPLAQAVEWVLQAAHALAEAHARQIIHRDVKPANLFLAETSAGQLVKVLDFGISKQLDASEVELTNTLSAVGTPRYMAPEQMRAAKFADARADIWSLGVVLYELTTGRTPFQGDSVTALCFDVMERTPTPPSRLVPEIPPSFDALMAQCLEKDPDDRFQSMEALARALTPFARASLYAGLFGPPSWPSGAVAGSTPMPLDRSSETRLEAPRAVPTPLAPTVVQHPLPHEQPPQETMRAWDTTAVPRVMPPEPRRPQRWLLPFGIAVGVLSATGMGMLIASRDSTAMQSSSNAPSASSIAATAPPSAAPTEPMVVAVPLSSTAFPSSSPPDESATPPAASASSAASSPSAVPSVQKALPPISPVIVGPPTRPTANCNPPTWTDSSGRKHVKAECNR